MFKFRSMSVDASGTGITAGGDARVTPAGRWLRRLKLDELPELWNVLRGDMALVGPRPEVPEFVDNSDPLWQEVLAVRPGLTDPVTLKLRDEEGLLAGAPGDLEVYYRETLQPAKLAGYAEYARTRTALSDLRILVATIWAILSPSARLESESRNS
jgi:lipopolysaccharide/colanic/teichoic acid biosynthesis glycosyltransferase